MSNGSKKIGSISKGKRGNIAFLFLSRPSFQLQRCLFENVLDSGYNIILCCGNDDEKFHQEISVLAIDGISLVILSRLPRAGLWTRILCRLPAYRWSAWRAAIASIFITKKRTFFSILSALSNKKAAVRRFLNDAQVNAVICSEDGISGDLPFLAAAKAEGIPVLDIPYGCGRRYELEFDLAEKISREEALFARGPDLAAARVGAPQWLNDGMYKNAIVFPVEQIVAREYIGSGVKNAWIIHGGSSDLLCAENQVGLEQYVREGIDPKKLHLTGSPYCDQMLDALTVDEEALKALRQPRKILRGKTKILVSWPPSYHETYPGRSEFETYREMVGIFFSNLKKISNAEILVSIHPACSREIIDMIFEEDVNVTNDYIIDIIAQNDIFITYYSSTIRWSLAAGKVVLNYDAYDINIPTFDNAPGFLSFSNMKELIAFAHRLADDDEYFAKLSYSQIEKSEEWGILDGQCNERILAEIGSLIQTNVPKI